MQGIFCSCDLDRPEPGSQSEQGINRSPWMGEGSCLGQPEGRAAGCEAQALAVSTARVFQQAVVIPAKAGIQLRFYKRKSDADIE